MSIDLVNSKNTAAPAHMLPDGDATLVAAAKDGDRSAFDELVRRHRQTIFRLAGRMTRNREDAEEVVQDSFIQAFVHLEKFNGDSRFSTWLTRIAVNQALMLLRKRRRWHEVSLDDAESHDVPILRELSDHRGNPEQRYSRQEMLRMLDNAVAELAPNLRTAVQLREMQELTTKETTRVLGLTVSALKSRLFHARSKLRRALDPHLRQRADRALRSGYGMGPLQPAAPSDN